MIKKSDWSMLVIPAIAPDDETYRTGPGERDVYRRREGEVLLPEREPAEVLDATRRELGSMNFSAQYMQDPVPPGGNVIKREWLRYFDEEPGSFDILLASWDLASTISEASSYSVGTLWGAVGHDYYLLELFRARLESPDLRAHIIRLTNEWGPHVTLVEETELGRSLVQDLRRTTELSPRLFRPSLEKSARLLAQAARFEAGRVHLPAHASWLRAYEDELLAFPYGRQDDQVDVTSQALHELVRRAGAERPLVRSNARRRDVERRYERSDRYPGVPSIG